MCLWDIIDWFELKIGYKTGQLHDPLTKTDNSDCIYR